MSSNEKWGQRSLLALLPLWSPVSAQQTKAPNLSHVSPLLSALFSPTFFWLWSGIIGLEERIESEKALLLRPPRKCTSSLRDVENKRPTVLIFIPTFWGTRSRKYIFPYEAQLVSDSLFGRQEKQRMQHDFARVQTESLECISTWQLLSMQKWSVSRTRCNDISPLWMEVRAKSATSGLKAGRDPKWGPLFAKRLRNTKRRAHISVTTAEPVKESCLL